MSECEAGDHRLVRSDKEVLTKNGPGTDAAVIVPDSKKK